MVVSELTCAPAAATDGRWPVVDVDRFTAAVKTSLTELTRCIDLITVAPVVYFARRDVLVTHLAAALRSAGRVAANLGFGFVLPAAVPPIDRVQDALRELGEELSGVRSAVHSQIDSDLVTLLVTGTRLDATAQWILAIADYCGGVRPCVIAAFRADAGQPAAALSQGGFCPPSAS